MPPPGNWCQRASPTGCRSISPLIYDCALPHSGQNFAPFGMGLPQLMQNFVSVPGAGAGEPPPPAGAGPAGLAGGGASPGFSAFIICCAIVSPAPSPTPMPATPPPPSLAAATGSELAT